MKKLLIGLLVLVVFGAVGIELVAPQLAAAKIEDNVRGQTSGVGEVSADVGTFPVVTRLLATEEVPRVGLTLEEVAAQQLSFASVRFELRGVRLDRDALLGGDVRVRSMRGGQVTATLDLDDLSEALGVPVRVEDGNVIVTVAGADIEVPLALAGRQLSLPAGLGSVPLPDVVSCTAAETVVAEGRIEVSCALDDVPEILT